jgi:hypothetical protein
LLAIFETMADEQEKWIGAERLWPAADSVILTQR